MFDLRNVVENYVKADNMAANGSAYKTTATSAAARHPVHLIDKYSLNTNLGRYMRVRFSVEYLVGTTVEIDINTQANTAIPFIIFNGYVKHTDVLNKSGNNFGYNTAKFTLTDNTSEFLTNAPTTQYANLEDYGTLSMVTSTTGLYRIRLNYYDSE
jgi:ribosomal protein L21E